MNLLERLKKLLEAEVETTDIIEIAKEVESGKRSGYIIDTGLDWQLETSLDKYFTNSDYPKKLLEIISYAISDCGLYGKDFRNEQTKRISLGIYSAHTDIEKIYSDIRRIIGFVPDELQREEDWQNKGYFTVFVDVNWKIVVKGYDDLPDLDESLNHCFTYRKIARDIEDGKTSGEYEDGAVWKLTTSIDDCLGSLKNGLDYKIMNHIGRDIQARNYGDNEPTSGCVGINFGEGTVRTVAREYNIPCEKLEQCGAYVKLYVDYDTHIDYYGGLPDGFDESLLGNSEISTQDIATIANEVEDGKTEGFIIDTGLQWRLETSLDKYNIEIPKRILEIISYAITDCGLDGKNPCEYQTTRITVGNYNFNDSDEKIKSDITDLFGVYPDEIGREEAHGFVMMWLGLKFRLVIVGYDDLPDGFND